MFQMPSPQEAEKSDNRSVIVLIDRKENKVLQVGSDAGVMGIYILKENYRKIEVNLLVMSIKSAYY